MPYLRSGRGGWVLSRSISTKGNIGDIVGQRQWNNSKDVPTEISPVRIIGFLSPRSVCRMLVMLLLPSLPVVLMVAHRDLIGRPGSIWLCTSEESGECMILIKGSATLLCLFRIDMQVILVACE